jgi:hypothetical protein
MSPVFAAKRERLAWRTSGDQIHTRPYFIKNKITDIPFPERPIRDWPIASVLVLTDRIAAITIFFNYGDWFKSSPTYAYSQSTGSSK